MTELLPPVNEAEANDILAQVDSLINWRKSAMESTERADIRMSRLIATVASQTYWIVRGYAGEEEYIKATFPWTRGYYYNLKTIGTTLMPYPVQMLEQIGISKCRDLVRIHKHCGGVIPQNWFLHAMKETRDDFKQRVKEYVTKCLPLPRGAKEEDEGIVVSFKVWKSLIPVYNKAMEIAMLESGSTSRSNAFGNILGDYLSGHNEDGSRLKDQNQFNIDEIGRRIEDLNPLKDPTIYDRALGRIRSGFERLKAKYDGA